MAQSQASEREETALDVLAGETARANAAEAEITTLVMQSDIMNAQLEVASLRLDVLVDDGRHDNGDGHEKTNGLAERLRRVELDHARMSRETASLTRAKTDAESLLVETRDLLGEAEARGESLAADAVKAATLGKENAAKAALSATQNANVLKKSLEESRAAAAAAAAAAETLRAECASHISAREAADSARLAAESEARRAMASAAESMAKATEIAAASRVETSERSVPILIAPNPHPRRGIDMTKFLANA